MRKKFGEQGEMSVIAERKMRTGDFYEQQNNKIMFN